MKQDADALIDRLWRTGRHEAARRLLQAQVVAVPFCLARSDAGEGGMLGALEQGNESDIDNIVPRRDGHLHCEWARPPFPKTIIVSEHGSAGFCLLVDEVPREEWPEVRDPATGQEARVEWMAQAVEVINGVPVFAAWVMAEPGGRGQVAKLEDDQWLHILAWWGIDPVALKKHFDIEGSAIGRVGSETITTFALMNCKNVQIREEAPPRQLRRSAERDGRPRPFTVKTLWLDGRPGENGISAGGAGPVSRHWVRGHFKTYEPGRGLFGRADGGIYWWSPHLAGDVRAGVVVKTYALARPDKEDHA